MNKFHAIRECVNGISFASKYEAKVYRHLKYWASKNPLRFTVNCQVPITIYNGLAFPKRNWKCDFTLSDNHTKKRLLIEAKGLISPEFPYILELLSLTSPNDFNSLIIVTENDKFLSERYRNLNSLTSSELNQYLQGLIRRGIHGNSSL